MFTIIASIAHKLTLESMTQVIKSKPTICLTTFPIYKKYFFYFRSLLDLLSYHLYKTFSPSASNQSLYKEINKIEILNGIVTF